MTRLVLITNWKNQKRMINDYTILWSSTHSDNKDKVISIPKIIEENSLTKFFLLFLKNI